MTAVNPLPNILTWIRLVAGLIMFTLLAGAAGGIPFLSDQLVVDSQFDMIRWAFFAFVLGAVTDFLGFYLGSYRWPDFNIADSAISIGLGLLLVDSLRPRRASGPAPRAPSA